MCLQDVLRASVATPLSVLSGLRLRNHLSGVNQPA
jgi:hypothetical protein